MLIMIFHTSAIGSELTKYHYLNTNKTELVLFKSKRKLITKKLNFRISGQRILPSK